jgi:hypothetical protein
MPALTQYSTLQSVKVTGNIYDSVCKFHVEQTYMSYNDHPLEITYQFSLDPNAHIVGVSADIGDKTYQGEIKGREESRRAYDEGITNKLTVLRLTKSQYSTGDYVLELGNIEPKTRVVVRYTYITIVPAIADTFTYVFPTNIAPRYTPTKGTSADRNWNSGFSHLTYSTNTAYHFEFDITVETSGRLEAVDSNLMRSATKLSDRSYRLKGTVVPSDGTMVVTYKTAVKPCMYTNNGLYCYIRYDFPMEDAKDTRAKKYSILVDRSGSMESDGKMEDCRTALEFTLDSLPPGSLFNIVSFGSNYEFMWPEARPYTTENRNIARALVRSFKADMGGTELFHCLEHVLTGKVSDEQPKGRAPAKWLSDRGSSESPAARTDEPEHIIILMTDGQVSSAHNMSQMVKRTANTRLCTLGIGRDANRNELDLLANGGRGFCYMASDSKDITTLITNMIANCCMYKYFTNIKVNNKQVAAFGYPNNINTMYYKRESPDEVMTLTYEDPEQPGITVTRKIDVTVVEGDNTITQLYYANMEPENESALLEHSVLTRVNSFFLKSTEKIKTEGALAKETVTHYASGGQTSEYLSYQVKQVKTLMMSNIDKVLERGEPIGYPCGLTAVANAISLQKSLGTPCGAEIEEDADSYGGLFDGLEEQNEMISENILCSLQPQRMNKARFEVRACAAQKSSSIKRMASSASAIFASAKNALGFGNTNSLTSSEPVPVTKSVVTNTTDIMSFRNPDDGSFSYALELLTLIGYTESEFQKYLAEHSVSQAKGLNQLVMEYLVGSKDSKYALVIASLRQYLQKC